VETTISAELERRVRFTESEIEGEKAVTRYVLQQVRANNDNVIGLRTEVAALGARVDRLADDMAVANAALRNHGMLLTMLQQDVGALRSDVTALRRGQEELHARMDRLETRVDSLEARMDRLEARMDRLEARMDRLEARMDGLEARMDRLEAQVQTGFDEVKAQINQLQQGVAAILAAVTPRT
jgi:chromosome segregation ATPase